VQRWERRSPGRHPLRESSERRPPAGIDRREAVEIVPLNP